MASTAESEATVQQEKDETIESFPPSHILQNGRFIYLPPPTDAERAKFLERSIARHNLLGADLGSVLQEEEEEKEEEKKESSQPKIHPLAIASARLQANGIDELSKAINLSGLVSTGDYFGLANIVDPSLEVSSVDNAARASQTSPEEPRLRAEYIGKRKRAQFQKAADGLERHERRIAAAITVQSIIDERLRQLRLQWRLVAPEHGTRSQPHAVRPSELVAIDVDVYDRDRTGGGIQSGTTVGRIARRVPRYATLELQDNYNVKEDLESWKNQSDEDDKMDVDNEETPGIKTRAEPFAVADPTLGKIDVDFDPDKVPMLTLQFEIARPSTGFRQSACLSPLKAAKDGMDEADESLVVSLQHSLFCASLFESIRRELVPEEADNTVGGFAKVRRTAWLSTEMNENFLPSPSLMAGGDDVSGEAHSLAVVHCHEGEVMVQLDCEYSLTVRLVEAGNDNDDSMQVDDASAADSGSQSPGQLQALCRALLLHAQTVYHAHSTKSRALAQQKEKKQAPGLARIKKKDKMPSARILENCVKVGAKMIFERKIRKAIARVREWVKSTVHTTAEMMVEWLPLSAFDLHSELTLSFLSTCLDVSIHHNEMRVTNMSDGGYRRVTFRTETEFELFLRMEIRKRVKSEEAEQAGALTPIADNMSKSTS